MRVAVIIPALDRDAALERTLAGLERLEPVPDCVAVVDGAASQSCALVCRAAGAQWIPAHPGRGGQLALGAAHTHADVLWFLRIDCEPHAGAVAAIRGAIAAGAAGGYFRFEFAEPATRAKRLLERCIAWRCRWGTVYGDQGLFVARGAYEASPGFAVQPLFEEVALVRALKHTGRFVALPLPITISVRRWERDGYLKRTLLNRLLAVGFSFGISPARLARWHGGRLSPAPAGHASAGRASRRGDHEAHEG